MQLQGATAVQLAMVSQYPKPPTDVPRLRYAASVSSGDFVARFRMQRLGHGGTKGSPCWRSDDQPAPQVPQVQGPMLVEGAEHLRRLMHVDAHLWSSPTGYMTALLTMTRSQSALVSLSRAWLMQISLEG